MDISELVEQFEQRFGDTPRVFRAPGRVNLIGEHTDYNNGFVMPAAIQFSTWALAAPRKDSKLALYSRNFDECLVFDDLSSVAPRKHWTDYVVGVAARLYETDPRAGGANMLLYGDVPLGAGLSSSASLEIASAYALASVHGQDIDRISLAKLCQQAENQFVGARCGIMDQFVSSMGEPGHCLLIDCESLEYKAISMPAHAVMVIGNSMVKHSIAGGEYNIRRSECEQAVRLLSKTLPGRNSLRDFSPAQLEELRAELPPVIYRRARHVISENQRVLASAEALRADDLQTFGRKMNESHISLRDDYQVSCPELDGMVQIAQGQAGVYGARMTGGGFGGCTVSMVQKDYVDSAVANIRREYTARFSIHPEIYVSSAVSGVKEVLGVPRRTERLH